MIIEWSPESLKTATIETVFQLEDGSVKHLLNNLERISESSGEHACITMAGILSGPDEVEGSKKEITLATDVAVIRK